MLLSQNNFIKGGLDGSMILRMVEYDFMIALSETRQDKTYLQFPRSCIIYLRSNKNTLNEEQMEMRLADGQTVMYSVPVLRLKDYSVEEIFEKNLLILLPYYIINYEKELSQIAKDEKRTQSLVEEFQKIICRLAEATKDDETGLFRDMAGMIRRIIKYMLRREPDLKERVSKVMGGKVLRLPSDALREARAAGVASGKAEGKAETTIIIVQNMLKRGMPIEDICALAECDIELVEKAREQL